MRNVKLTLEYDGSDFAGWQTQASGRTVQEEVTKVLREVLQEDVTIEGAGRTDAGVHARGQVANFLTNSTLGADAILQALNGMLPTDIRVRSAREVSELFQARFHARARLYKYYISLKQQAIGRQYQWYVKYPLDVGAMKCVAELVAGDHDFSSFCNNAAEVEDRSCTVIVSRWTQSPKGLIYEVKANRFIHGMVRALVGTMVDIGRGHIPSGSFSGIMEAKDRSKAGMAAPAHGLCLEEVVY